MPDGIWVLRDLISAFEAKSEEDKNHSISISTCRQALGHKNWISDKKGLSEQQEINVIVLSHKEEIHVAALPHAKNIFHLEVEELIEISIRITRALRKIRSKVSKVNGNTLFTKEYIYQVIEQEKLSYHNVIKLLKRKRLSEMVQGR